MERENGIEMDENFKSKNRVKDILGEPYPLQLTEYEERVRRNLLAYSVVSISAGLLGAVSVDQPVLFGVIKLPKFSSDLIYYGLSLLVVYELVNYGLMLWNSFSYWRVRLTGSRLKPSRSSGDAFASGLEDIEDVAGEEKNSTIYTWLFEQQFKAESILGAMNDRSKQLLEVQEDLKSKGATPDSLAKFETNLNMLEQSMERLEGIISSARVHESFLRYDRWFHYMLKTQSLRWLILDCAIPMIIGVIALILLLSPLFRNCIAVILNYIVDFAPIGVDAVISL